MKVSVRSFVEDVFANEEDSVNKKFILMHTTYLIASASKGGKLNMVALRYFQQMKDFVTNMTVSY